MIAEVKDEKVTVAIVVPDDKPELAEAMRRAWEAWNDPEVRAACASVEAAWAYIDAAPDRAERRRRKVITFAARWGNPGSIRRYLAGVQTVEQVIRDLEGGAE